MQALAIEHFFRPWLAFVVFRYSIAMTLVIYPTAGCLVFQDPKNALRQLYGITNMNYLIIVISLLYLLYFMIISIFWCGVNTILIVGGGGGVVWTKATHLSVTISGNLLVQQKCSVNKHHTKHIFDFSGWVTSSVWIMKTSSKSNMTTVTA